MLLVIGIGSGLVILYDYSTSPHLISKEKAFSIATRAGNWSQNLLSDKTVNIKLLHVKNDGFTFVVDENTLLDKSLSDERLNGLKNGQYVWIVTVTGQPPNILSGRQWGYMINATNGELLQVTS
jgi:hypothetical protein